MTQPSRWGFARVARVAAVVGAGLVFGTASLFAQAAASLGYKTFQKPTAAMTRPYTNPYRLTLGQCVSGGCVYSPTN